MTTTDWIAVAVALGGGIVVGLVLSRLAYAFVSSQRRPQPVQMAAGAVRSLVLWLCVVVGLIFVLGIVSPRALDRLPQDAIAFAPRMLSAVIILIVANVLTSIAVASIAPMLARSRANTQRQALNAIKGSIMGLATVLAVRQLGVDTLLINLALGALFFGVAATFATLIAFGGRDVATQVASVRAARRLVKPGDHIKLADIEGTVTNMHPTALEIRTTDGRTVLTPASRLITETYTIERGD